MNASDDGATAAVLQWLPLRPAAATVVAAAVGWEGPAAAVAAAVGWEARAHGLVGSGRWCGGGVGGALAPCICCCCLLLPPLLVLLLLLCQPPQPPQNTTNTHNRRYLEIYNEEIRDLLGRNQAKRLNVHESPETGVCVAAARSFSFFG